MFPGAEQCCHAVTLCDLQITGQVLHAVLNVDESLDENGLPVPKDDLALLVRCFNHRRHRRHGAQVVCAGAARSGQNAGANQHGDSWLHAFVLERFVGSLSWLWR